MGENETANLSAEQKQRKRYLVVKGFVVRFTGNTTALAYLKGQLTKYSSTLEFIDVLTEEVSADGK